jgi:hypothetical protein
MNIEKMFNKALNQSWSGFKNYPFTLIGATFLEWLTVCGLIITLTGILGILSRFSVLPGPYYIGLMPMSMALLVLCLAWLSLGIIEIVLKITRNQQPHLSDLYCQHSKVIPAVIGYAIYWILVSLGILLLLIPGIYVALSWYFFPYVLVDKNVSLFKAFKQSSELTQGIKLYLLLYVGALYFLLLIPVVNLIVVVVHPLVTAYLYRITEQARYASQHLPNAEQPDQNLSDGN